MSCHAARALVTAWKDCATYSTFFELTMQFLKDVMHVDKMDKSKFYNDNIIQLFLRTMIKKVPENSPKTAVFDSLA